MLRKSLSILFIFIFSTGFCIAQEHLKFMGIPLNGTINQFQAKLATKGITVDYATNKDISVGCRAFKGTFSGKSALIYVYYNEKNKIVYRAKAVIQSLEKDINDNVYNYFVQLLTQKYSDAESIKGTNEYLESRCFLLHNDENEIYKYLGRIDVYRTSYSFFYYTHVDYTDTYNDVKNDSRNMDDL